MQIYFSSYGYRVRVPFMDRTRSNSKNLNFDRVRYKLRSIFSSVFSLKFLFLRHIVFQHFKLFDQKNFLIKKKIRLKSKKVHDWIFNAKKFAYRFICILFKNICFLYLYEKGAWKYCIFGWNLQKNTSFLVKFQFWKVFHW